MKWNKYQSKGSMYGVNTVFAFENGTDRLWQTQYYLPVQQLKFNISRIKSSQFDFIHEILFNEIKVFY